MPGISFSIWSVLIIIGAIQALFLAVSLFFNRQNGTAANRILALLLLVIALNLAEYAVAVTGLNLQFPHLTAVSYPFLYTMGPLYWLYTKKSLLKDFVLKPVHLLHLLPFLGCLLLLLPFYWQSAGAKVAFLHSLVRDNRLSVPVSQLVFMSGHVLQTGIYVLISRLVILHQYNYFTAQSANTRYARKLFFIKKFTWWFLGWLLMYLVAVIIIGFNKSYPVQVDYVSVLVTSLLMFAIGYMVLNNPLVFCEMVDIKKEEIPLPVKYGNNQLPDEKIQQVKHSLENYFTHKKPYFDYNLKLPDVAAALGVSTQQLSQVINKEYQQGFYDFVNSYRVDEAKKQLVNTGNDHLTILAIAFDVGFNSKATFNRVFKKFTMLTPSEYREKFAVNR